MSVVTCKTAVNFINNPSQYCYMKKICQSINWLVYYIYSFIYIFYIHLCIFMWICIFLCYQWIWSSFWNKCHCLTYFFRTLVSSINSCIFCNEKGNPYIESIYRSLYCLELQEVFYSLIFNLRNVFASKLVQHKEGKSLKCEQNIFMILETICTKPKLWRMDFYLP